jgi:hypothetical protein
MDSSVLGYIGMKGLIDLRVADILAKQAALQHKAALYQSHISQHESDKAALYTARAEAAMEGGDLKIPHSSTWYQPSKLSFINKGKYLPSARPSDSSESASTRGTFLRRTARADLEINTLSLTVLHGERKRREFLSFI